MRLELCLYGILPPHYYIALLVLAFGVDTTPVVENLSKGLQELNLHFLLIQVCYLFKKLNEHPVHARLHSQIAEVVAERCFHLAKLFPGLMTSPCLLD